MTAPAPHHAQAEETRAEGLARMSQHIAADPSDPLNNSRWLYQHCAQQAFAAAAEHTEQPTDTPR